MSFTTLITADQLRAAGTGPSGPVVIEASFDLGGFSGVDAKGDWTLSVVDSAAQDTGTLKSWALTLGR